jgi:glyoxylase-like metal-dependent hydrolase (beta-lactamase superfamily II)
VHCIRNGLHELEGRGPVEAFDFGDELPGGAVAHEVGVICPDETALYIRSHRALACADGVVQWGGPQLTFVPDFLMDDPEQTKAGLRAAYGRLLELDFDTLLLAHGEPFVGDGKQALREFVEG